MITIDRSLQPVAISHPLVRKAYFKKDLGHNNCKGEDVLVLETHSHEDDSEYTGFDSYLIDLLTDLQNLKDQAEKTVGSIDRIDIRKY